MMIGSNRARRKKVSHGVEWKYITIDSTTAECVSRAMVILFVLVVVTYNAIQESPHSCTRTLLVVTLGNKYEDCLLPCVVGPPRAHRGIAFECS